MFIGIAVVALVILVGGTMMLKNVSELKNPKLNVLSVILSTIAFGGLLYGFSSASTMGWASPVVITSIVVGLVAFVAFVYKQVKLDEPLLRVDTLATRNFRNSAILVTLINAAVAATNVTLPIFIQNVLGQSATVTGMVKGENANETLTYEITRADPTNNSAGSYTITPAGDKYQSPVPHSTNSALAAWASAALRS